MAVICHGGVISVVLATVLGITHDDTMIHRSATEHAGFRSIVTTNETAHLRTTGLPTGPFQKG